MNYAAHQLRVAIDVTDMFGSLSLSTSLPTSTLLSAVACDFGIDMALYDPPETSEPTKPVNVRLPLNTHNGLMATARLWRMFAKARGDEWSPINLSYVIRRMLRLGVQEAFAEFGAGVPTDEAGWAALEHAVLEKVSGPTAKKVARKAH